MDFFERQDVARRGTRWLVVLFTLAVIGVVVAVNVAVVTILLFNGSGEPGELVRPGVLGAISAFTLTLIGTSSLYKIASLSSGGPAVAQLLGGKPLDPNTGDPASRRLLNVVEEMALAAGTSVPTVYVLEEEYGINAFAAGFTLDDAVIGVTRGALDLLDRDELAGVIGHEMSHLLHGDSRLNVRLMGVLHGILVIGLIGYWILRSYRGGSSSGRGKKGGAGAVLLFGLALLVIGYVGVFFAKLIKSAVSRQREFLADAASAQYTRDPLGLAGALKKIGGLSGGSRLANPNAEQASHMFFGNGVGKPLFAWLETHPPLTDRILRLDPSFDGTFPRVEAKTGPPRPVQTKGPPSPRPAREAAAAVLTQQLTAEGAVASVGSPTPEHVAYAAALSARLPQGLAERVREPASARAVVCALLLSRDPLVAPAQLVALAAHAGDEPLLEEVSAVMPAIKACPPEARLALVDLAVPALRLMSRPQWSAFSGLVTRLVEADDRLDVFELALRRVLMRHVEPTFGRAIGRAAVRFYSLKRHGNECSALLSALAWRGGSGTGIAPHEVAAESFARGAAHLPGIGAVLLPEAACGPREVEASLRELDGAAPRRKQDLLIACAVVIAHDRRVNVEEGELLRALADGLQCPMPPLLPGEALAAA